MSLVEAHTPHGTPTHPQAQACLSLSILRSYSPNRVTCSDLLHFLPASQDWES